MDDEECPAGEICQAGQCVSAVGCSDGTREGFGDATSFGRIAGCGGGWSLPGMTNATTCGRQAGNSSSNPDGDGCSTGDLCAANFHVCDSDLDVAGSAPMGCSGATEGATGQVFFATLQSGPGFATCSGANGAPCVVPPSESCDGLCNDDLFGCGDLGNTPDMSCGVLDATSGNLCGALGAPWDCPSTGGPPSDPYANGCSEFLSVTKTGPQAGGVLCCAN